MNSMFSKLTVELLVIVKYGETVRERQGYGKASGGSFKDQSGMALIG